MVKETSVIHIKIMSASSISQLVRSFQSVGWSKSKELFETYLKEQEGGERLIWIAYFEDQIAGYVTLKWESLCCYVGWVNTLAFRRTL